MANKYGTIVMIVYPSNFKSSCLQGWWGVHHWWTLRLIWLYIPRVAFHYCSSYWVCPKNDISFVFVVRMVGQEQTWEKSSSLIMEFPQPLMSIWVCPVASGYPKNFRLHAPWLSTPGDSSLAEPWLSTRPQNSFGAARQSLAKPLPGELTNRKQLGEHQLMPGIIKDASSRGIMLNIVWGGRFEEILHYVDHHIDKHICAWAIRSSYLLKLIEV